MDRRRAHTPATSRPAGSRRLATLSSMRSSTEAIQRNGDLRAAAARVEQAAAYVKVAGGELYPTVDATRSRGRRARGGDSSGLEGVTRYRLVGARRLGPSAIRKARPAKSNTPPLSRISILRASPSPPWWRSPGSWPPKQRCSMHCSPKWWTPQPKLTALAEQRFRVGIGSELDVASARVNEQTYRDSLRQVELALEQAVRSLELLVGRYPGAQLTSADAARITFHRMCRPGCRPNSWNEGPMWSPHRMRVAVAFSRYKESQAARFPKISLTGSGSDLTSDLFVLQDRENPVWSVGGSVFAPLFRGGALKAQAEVRSAEQKEALAHYVHDGAQGVRRR